MPNYPSEEQQFPQFRRKPVTQVGVNLNWDYMLGSNIVQNLATGLANNSPNSVSNAVLRYNTEQNNPVNYLPYTPNNSLQDLYGSKTMEEGGEVTDDWFFDDDPEVQKEVPKLRASAAINNIISPEQNDEELFNSMSFTGRGHTNWEEGEFKDKLGNLESAGNYSATNPNSSAVGKYQFLWKSWKSDIKDVTGVSSKEDFKNSPEAQEKFMGWYDVNILTPQAGNLYADHQGYSIDQLKALVHFKGGKGAQEYLSKGIDKTKKNNISIPAYINKFEQGGETGEGCIDENGNPIPCPQGVKDGTMIVNNLKDKRLLEYNNRPTSTDSLQLYNNSVEIQNYYKNKGYRELDPKNALIVYTSQKTALSDLKNHLRIGEHPTTNRSIGGARDPQFNISEYYQKIDNNKYKQREVYTGELDLASPFPLYDKRIKPTLTKHYSAQFMDRNNPLFEDEAQLPFYDPIAIKPWNQLSIKEKAERVSKYGKPKSIQPVIYKEREFKLVPDNSRYQSKVSGNIIQGQQAVIPQPEGDYIYGPANSVIGVNQKGKFIPVNMPEQRGLHPVKGVNNPDLDLLNNPEELHKYVSAKGLQYKDGGWIAGAINPNHVGFCSPVTKDTCTLRRKAFAMRAKNHFKEDGGIIFEIGGEYQLDDAQIQDMINQGYEFE